MRSLVIWTSVGSMLVASVVALVCAEGCKSERSNDSSPTATENAPVASSVPSASALAVQAAVPPPAPIVLDTPLPEEDLYPKTLAEQRAAMLRRMKVMLALTDPQLDAMRKVFDASKILGQGNPKVAAYPLTRKECREKREAAHVIDVLHPICGGPYMMPLYDPKAGETEADAKACIDEYEFPDMPCDYPVTWVSSREASQLCQAVGKRLCDAHEWEGGCAGALHSPDVEYAWGKPRKEMKILHNKSREIVWAYGSERRKDVCGTHSHKSKTCERSGWKECGSNTFPAGSFPECKSPLGVYDQHGNAAEHMNMPRKPADLTSRGGFGETEMKGSWFAFDVLKEPPHEDDCRWRAPDWHVSRIMTVKSHANYHLGFRCCKSVGGDGSDGDAGADAGADGGGSDAGSADPLDAGGD